jgi:hypothetical protein
MALRETGSILVSAPRDRVFEVVRARMQQEPGLRTMTAERIESERSTWVLQDAPDGGTRVVHALVQSAFLVRPKAELRRAVTDELLAVQKLATREES